MPLPATPHPKEVHRQIVMGASFKKYVPDTRTLGPPVHEDQVGCKDSRVSYNDLYEKTW